MKNMFTDIAIIGGGASGLLCGCAISRRYLNENKKISVTIFEKQQRVGRKILSTGNGKCNLTNVYANSENYHGSFARYVDNLFQRYSPSYVVEYFKKIGLLCNEDSNGRVYPLCKQASAVLDVLRFENERNGVELVCDADVIDIKKSKGFFQIITSNGNYQAKSVVIATGGKAASKLGSDVKIYNALKKLGHSCKPLSPALCAVPVKSDVIKSLKGVRCDGDVTLLCNGKAVKKESGEIQFTENSLSGICVFNLSGFINSGNKNNKYEIAIDLLPDFSINDVKILLKGRISLYKNEVIENLFVGLFHKRIGLALLKQSGIKTLSDKCSTLTVDEIDRLCENIKSLRFTALPTDSFDNAQVTSGGISGSEIDCNTLESRLVKNLYFCGEVIDIYGDCGGYNLQFAFACALAVGDNL